MDRPALGQKANSSGRKSARASEAALAEIDLPPEEAILILVLMGITPLCSPHASEWDTDLLFKKPWTLSKKLEFMAGVGPEWILTRAKGRTRNSLGGEVALDLMYWPAAKHRWGWFVEPGYEYNFGRGHEKALGVSGGLLIGIR